MNANSPIIDKTRQYVEDLFTGEGSGHDWWHVYRVWTLAKKIADAEGADRTIVELAALLHDVADWKLDLPCNDNGLEKVRLLLEKDVDPSTLREIFDIIANLSFKGSGVPTPMQTLSGKIVQDADRLDAIGAVGIARTFAYGGNKGRLIYHPEQTPVIHNSFEEYKRNDGHTINHFYEKLLLLKDRMNTKTAKQIAQQRHIVMEQYLNQFFREWNGES